ncbi:hypothetical protein [Tenebrionibacter intestinalis]|uniref:Uncharacterized protein n=1 Tax=Tenebrionibacter intestinalis TaxID=2799638 RepID=A0A8K0XXX1_9ENTR|nr:hypothetical protein [Tenebrionibacter intestinalis]MBK4717060.1 hypothetical protein [Tenebrionibacter intestinalis]
MKWNIPVMEDAPLPPRPRWWLWAIALLIILLAGFLLAVYTLEGAQLQNKSQLLTVACGGPFLLWLVMLGVRIMVYEFSSLRVSARNDMLAVRRCEWKRWVNQGMSVLAAAHYTQPDEQGVSLSPDGQLPVNNQQRLAFEQLAGLPEWERRAIFLSRLLAPVADFVQQTGCREPLTLRFRCASDDENDWRGDIEKQAISLNLPLRSVEPLETPDIFSWLATACDDASEEPVCLIFTEFGEASFASEEGACLLLASPAWCRARRYTPVSNLPRPLSSPPGGLSQALQQMFDWQHPARGLAVASYSAVPAAEVEKLHLICRGALCDNRILLDVDNALGNGAGARHAVQLALACRFAPSSLLLTFIGGEYRLQQVISGAQV